ncbi:PLATZ transcription factor family protein [Actinidia rufa]|uniref:PLATZ transcription factor family protein n=1 Tax=Actinidia rufa TaxID=165716 RepID=A0A7J0DSY9_9ERIC|nr:PLATZ transcription factor family protein [Actinidia rufa]
MGIQKPAWLKALYTQKFFSPCPIHQNSKKNEKNICCLDCCTSICPHCVPSHHFHRLLQVRRYVYHDVVRLDDLEKLIDCSNVQADFVLKHYNDLSPYLRKCHTLQLSPDFFVPQDMGYDEMAIETPHSTIVVPDEPMSWSSGSSELESTTVLCTCFVQKKRSDFYMCARSPTRVLEEEVSTSISRRKGIPHRAPLC